MPNHISKIEIIVLNGTAPDERFPKIKKFKKSPQPQTTDG
jgi:hypothetical protein